MQATSTPEEAQAQESLNIPHRSDVQNASLVNKFIVVKSKQPVPHRGPGTEITMCITLIKRAKCFPSQ